MKKRNYKNDRKRQKLGGLKRPSSLSLKKKKGGEIE